MAKKKYKPKAVAVNGMGDSKSIDIRKIDNGYIVRESSWSNDKLEQRERFCSKMPAVKIDADPRKPMKGKMKMEMEMEDD